MAMSGLSDSLAAILAALVATGGIGLLFVGTYVLGFGWSGIASVVGGVCLFGLGVMALLRQDSAVSEKLIRVTKDLLLST